MTLILLLFTLVSGLQVSRDYVQVLQTDIYDGAWTDDNTIIRISANAFTFQNIHSASPPIYRVGDVPVCVTLDGDIICASF